MEREREREREGDRMDISVVEVAIELCVVSILNATCSY